jgi:microcystin-dependent protein
MWFMQPLRDQGKKPRGADRGVAMTTPFVGEIRLFSFPFAPRGWAMCNGAILSIQQNTALFSLLGTFYGGNGTTNFQLPDLRGRAAVSAGTLQGETITLGEMGGEENVTLTIPTMPSHNHALLATTTVADKRPAVGHFFATDNGGGPHFYGAPTTPVVLDGRSISPTGGSQPHTNMQPYLVMNYCIATTGVFPARN